MKAEEEEEEEEEKEEDMCRCTVSKQSDDTGP